MLENNPPFQQKRRSTLLDVASILTIIGSIFIMLFSFFFLFMDKFLDFIRSAPNVPAESLDQLELMEGKGLILFITSFIPALLCLVGAIYMRKFKKVGLPIYLVGEWLPFVLSPIVMGKFQFDGNMIFSFLIAALFTTFYIQSKKELTE